MHMEENQPESAATGSGGLGIDDTTLLEGVEQSSSQQVFQFWGSTGDT